MGWGREASQAVSPPSSEGGPSPAQAAQLPPQKAHLSPPSFGPAFQQGGPGPWSWVTVSSVLLSLFLHL